MVVFLPLSVYCERLILAGVCYAIFITGSCVLILHFCPSSVFLGKCVIFSFFFVCKFYFLLLSVCSVTAWHGVSDSPLQAGKELS